jgi:hypothetical protein
MSSAAEVADTLRDIKAGLENAQVVMRRASEQLGQRAERIQRLTEALAGLVGLFELLASRAASHPGDPLLVVVRDFRSNHRLLEARQVLEEELREQH